MSCFVVFWEGEPIYTVPGGTASVSIDYQKNVSAVGDHVIEALALDDKGTTARAGAGPVYVRIVPSTSAKAKPGQSQTASSSSTGKVFHVVNSGGLWDD